MRSLMRTKTGAHFVAAIGILGSAGSCSESAEPTQPELSAMHVHISPRRTGAPEPDAALRRKLDELKRATARYRNFAAARADGYTFEVTKCMEDATSGGMGYHYAKRDLIDPQVIEARPEVLLYEPTGKGRFRLVGVEFIIEFDAWTSAEPPVLYGQTFARNENFKVWALHVWVWRKNPSGVFADWNPEVSCARDNT
jgi:hypothetical protein